MIRHVAVFTWKPGTTPEQVAALQAGLAEMPGLIEEIRAYAVGPDAGLASGNGEFAVVADFDDADGFRRYSAHAGHRALVAELLAPIVGTRTAVQYLIEG